MERESDQSLTKLFVSDHESDSEPDTPINDIGPRFLTQHSVLEIESDSEPENSTTDSPSNDIGTQVMEYRLNSTSDKSTTRLTLRSITQDSVVEHNVLTRAIDH